MERYWNTQTTSVGISDLECRREHSALGAVKVDIVILEGSKGSRTKIKGIVGALRCAIVAEVSKLRLKYQCHQYKRSRWQASSMRSTLQFDTVSITPSCSLVCHLALKVRGEELGG